MVAAFVLDASVAAAWCFADESTPASDALRESMTDRIAVVPALWHAETANLLLSAERRRRITSERCTELLEQLDLLPVETVAETERARGPVLRLARTHGLTIYDASYLDLALQRGIELATRDQDLCRAARTAGVVLIAV
jgi:predicted nucleic acid-binding protein